VLREASAYAVQIMRGGRLEPIEQQIADRAPPEALRPDLSGPRVSAKEVQAMIPKQILGV
jgi:hypothetical protein